MPHNILCDDKQLVANQLKKALKSSIMFTWKAAKIDTDLAVLMYIETSFHSVSEKCNANQESTAYIGTIQSIRITGTWMRVKIIKMNSDIRQTIFPPVMQDSTYIVSA